MFDEYNTNGDQGITGSAPQEPMGNRPLGSVDDMVTAGADPQAVASGSQVSEEPEFTIDLYPAEGEDSAAGAVEPVIVPEPADMAVKPVIVPTPVSVVSPVSVANPGTEAAPGTGTAPETGAAHASVTAPVQEEEVPDFTIEIYPPEGEEASVQEQSLEAATQQMGKAGKAIDVKEQKSTRYTDYPLQKTAPQPAASGKKQKKKSGGSFVTKLLACASLGIVFGVCGGLGFYAIVKTSGIEFNQTPVIEEVQYVPENKILSGNEVPSAGVALSGSDSVKVVTSDVSDMVEKVMPAMVSIMNNYTSTTSIWGHSYSQESQASGSGIIVAKSDEELIMVTNHHVVADTSKLEVTFIDGETAEAQIKGSDADMDLAVIAIPLNSLKMSTLEEIAVVRMGDSENAKLGSPVIAIGNALGYGQSVTGGYLSAVNREITFNDGTTGKFLQTDAAINPGNSGGALLNFEGELIGINSSKIGGDSIDGIGFAIPISKAKPIIEELMAKQTKHKNASGKSGYLGIEPVSINDEAAYMYNYPRGVFVRNVETNSPAEEAGMLAGDIITRLDGDRISSYEDLAEALTFHEPGSTISVVVQRLNGGYFEEVELTITLGERPDGQ